jgi:hypothetical protein
MHDGTPTTSSTGLRQGGSEPMVGCNLGLHPILLQTSAWHPTSSVLAYADDTHCHHSTCARECHATKEGMQLYADEYLRLASVPHKGGFYTAGYSDDDTTMSYVPSSPTPSQAHQTSRVRQGSHRGARAASPAWGTLSARTPLGPPPPSWMN